MEGMEKICDFDGERSAIVGRSGVIFKANGASVNSMGPPPAVGSFIEDLRWIDWAYRAIPLWIADLWAAADRWGDEYVQHFDEITAIPYETQRRWARVMQRFPLDARPHPCGLGHYSAMYPVAVPTRRNGALIHEWSEAMGRCGKSCSELTPRELRDILRTCRSRIRETTDDEGSPVSDPGMREVFSDRSKFMRLSRRAKRMAGEVGELLSSPSGHYLPTGIAMGMIDAAADLEEARPAVLAPDKEPGFSPARCDFVEEDDFESVPASEVFPWLEGSSVEVELSNEE